MLGCRSSCSLSCSWCACRGPLVSCYHRQTFIHRHPSHSHMQALAHTYYVNVHTPSPTYPTLAKTHSGTDQPTDRYPHKNTSPHTIIAAYIIYTQTHIHASRTCAHAHIHTNMHTSIHNYIHTYTHIFNRHAPTHVYTSTDTHMHTYATYTHLYATYTTHICIQA